MATSAGLAAERPVLVLNNPTDPPLTTAAGDGLLDVVVGEAFRRAGVTLELVKLPAERGLINANAGIEDGDLSRIAGLEGSYPNLVRVPEKIFDMEFVGLRRTPASTPASWSALQPLRVGHIKGWKIFEQNLPPGTSIITAEGPEQLLQMLARDRIDVALYERWMGSTLAGVMHIADVRVAEPPLASREMFVYLHKRHASLVARVAEALRAVKREGLYQRTMREKLRPARPAPNP